MAAKLSHRVCVVGAVALGAVGGCARSTSRAAPVPSAPCALATSARAPAPLASAHRGPAIPDLAFVAAAKTVRIDRGRSGLLGGWMAHYELSREGSSFRGIMMFAAGRGGGRPLGSRAVVLTVPASAVDAFLAALSRVEPRRALAGPAVRLHVSDDYPFSLVDVEGEDAGSTKAARVVRFSSPRTGARPAPWFVWSETSPVELEPTSIDAALGALVPHLGDDPDELFAKLVDAPR